MRRPCPSSPDYTEEKRCPHLRLRHLFTCDVYRGNGAYWNQERPFPVHLPATLGSGLEPDPLVEKLQLAQGWGRGVREREPTHIGHLLNADWLTHRIEILGSPGWNPLLCPAHGKRSSTAAPGSGGRRIRDPSAAGPRV